MPDCLSPEQVTIALTDLAGTRIDRIFPLLFETFLFGILTLLVIASTYVLGSKGLRSRPRLLMLILTLTMYTLSAAIWAIDVDSACYDLSVMIPVDLAGGDGGAPGNDSNLYTALVEAVLVAVVYIIGDSIVLWRAYVIWGMHKGMCIFSVVLILVQICSWVVFTIGGVVSDTVPATPASFRPLDSPSAFADLTALAYSVSLAANVWATAMVGYRTWKHRRDVRRYLNNRTRKSAVEAVLLLLVESGVVYALLWVFYTISNIAANTVALSSSPTPNAAVTAESVWISGMNQIPGIYLTVVILVVAFQQSHRESTLTNMRSGAEISVPFSFRIPQTTVRTDDAQQHRSINVTIPDAHVASGPEIVMVARESTTSLSDDDDVHAGTQAGEKSG
ncbi:hypothetical protein OF83DRAFT_1178045 [Amylostereum chailletii]|nr:hypothetical protein OF83DRAFT_1178045 [Amylostereum chailletii]